VKEVPVFVVSDKWTTRTKTLSPIGIAFEMQIANAK